MLSGLLFIELIAHYYADIYDADKRGLRCYVNFLVNYFTLILFHTYTQQSMDIIVWKYLYWREE